MKKRIIFLIFALLIIIDVFLWIKADNTTPSYTTESMIVSDVRMVPIPGSKINKFERKVFVDHNGEEKEVKNLRGRTYIEGMEVDTYIYKDKVYADLAGVKSNSNIAYLYFFFLALTFLALIAVITLVVSERRKNQGKL